MPRPQNIHWKSTNGTLFSQKFPVRRKCSASPALYVIFSMVMVQTDAKAEPMLSMLTTGDKIT